MKKLIFIAASIGFFMIFAVEVSVAGLSEDEILNGFADPSLDESSIAIVELGSADWAEVTGEGIFTPLMIGKRGSTATNYRAITLAPKKYTIRWGRDGDIDHSEEYGVGVRIANYMNLFLEPGHRYLLQAELHSEKMSYLWVKNKTSGYSFEVRNCQSNQGYGAGTTIQLAKAGNADAQYQLGEWYAGSKCFSKGRPKFKSNYRKAVKWYERAAEQGVLKAQVKLAQLYSEGGEVKKNLKKANRWMEAAAEQGDPDSAYRLGVMYHEGEGVEVDLEQARKWYQIAADGGIFKAELALELIAVD